MSDPVVDTDGVLERCTCGARAGFVGHRVQCSECAECTDMYSDKTDAMVEWNRSVRDELNRK